MCARCESAEYFTPSNDEIFTAPPTIFWGDLAAKIDAANKLNIVKVDKIEGCLDAAHAKVTRFENKLTNGRQL